MGPFVIFFIVVCIAGSAIGQNNEGTTEMQFQPEIIYEDTADVAELAPELPPDGFSISDNGTQQQPPVDLWNLLESDSNNGTTLQANVTSNSTTRIPDVDSTSVPNTNSNSNTVSSEFNSSTIASWGDATAATYAVNEMDREQTMSREMDAFRALYQGYKNLTDADALAQHALPPFDDPLEMSDFNASYTLANVRFTNIRVYGLSNFTFAKWAMNTDTRTVGVRLFANSLNVTGNYSLTSKVKKASGPFLLRLLEGVVYTEVGRWPISGIDQELEILQSDTTMEYAKSKAQFTNIGFFTRIFQGTIGKKVLEEALLRISKEMKSKTKREILSKVKDQLAVDARMSRDSEMARVILQRVADITNPLNSTITIPTKMILQKDYITEVKLKNLNSVVVSKIQISASDNVMKTLIILETNAIAQGEYLVNCYDSDSSTQTLRQYSFYTEGVMLVTTLESPLKGGPFMVKGFKPRFKAIYYQHENRYPDSLESSVALNKILAHAMEDRVKPYMQSLLATPRPSFLNIFNHLSGKVAAPSS